MASCRVGSECLSVITIQNILNMELSRTDIQTKKVIEIVDHTNSKLAHIVNINEITNFVLKKFAVIDPPKEEKIIQYITFSSNSGIGGGSTIKPGNIILNWKKLLVEGMEHYLTIVGAAATPYLIPFAAIVVWNKVYALRQIKISENHAIVLSSLWDNRNYNNIVDSANILTIVNSYFSKYTIRQISKDEYNLIIDELYNLHILKLNSDGTIWLRECVRKQYA
jgi:hypothetical protein